jgi:uncharacterized pyridoxal phosphate-dependent enzyme
LLSQKNIYERLFGLQPLINLCGAWTPLGGSLPPQEAIQAAHEASRYFVDLAALTRKSGELVARLLGAEAALITSSSSAGIALAIAASMTGLDKRKARQLPDASGMRDEVIVQKGHFPYNFMVKAVGARLVEVGGWRYRSLGNLPEHIEGAISEKTCAIFHVESDNVPEGTLSLREVIAVAHNHDLPVIVDAADMLPPFSNVKRMLEMGADAVILSGWKAIQCFANTGIIIGRRNLIEACMIHAPPNHAIGRGYKVSKEIMVALVVTLEKFLSTDWEVFHSEEKRKADLIYHTIRNYAGVKNVVVLYPDESGVERYRLLITFDEGKIGMSAKDVYEKLKTGDPPIWTNPSYIPKGQLAVETWLASHDDVKCFSDRLQEVIAEK